MDGYEKEWSENKPFQLSILKREKSRYQAKHDSTSHLIFLSQDIFKRSHHWHVKTDECEQLAERAHGQNPLFKNDLPK